MRRPGNEMARLLPRGEAATFVDHWLHLAKATGECRRTVDK